jgi:nitrogen PTS system EIIA component
MQLNVRDVASVLEVPESTVNRWINERNLPAVRIGEQFYFNRTELLEWTLVRGVAISINIFQWSQEDPEERSTLSEAFALGGSPLRLAGTDKREIVEAVADRMPHAGGVDREFLRQVLLSREAIGMTSPKGDIAIPHPRQPIVLPIESPTLLICYLERAIDLDPARGVGVRTLLFLVSPTIRTHLQILARIGCLLRDEPFREVLARRGSHDEVLTEVRRVEASFGQARSRGKMENH